MSVEAELNRCRHWIESALEYSGGTHDFDDIKESIYKGEMQFWPAPEGCVVTELLRYPKKKVLHVFLAGGKMTQLTDMQADVSNWAKNQGAETLTIAGRFGWTRALEKFGWKKLYATIYKEIN